MHMLSNDQYFFIPVRSEDAPNPIDTLVGASNLGEISDIENHENFAKKIVEVLNENHHPQQIINSIKSRFSKEIILKKYEELLLKI